MLMDPTRSMYIKIGDNVRYLDIVEKWEERTWAR